MQYREKNGMAYELEHNGTQLTVRVAPRSNEDDPADWCIEARVGREKDADCVSGWAVTRREALQEVGRRWVSNELTHGLPSFDWEAVAKALSDVRAL